MEHRRPRRWEWLSLIPILAGLYWLLIESGGSWLFWALIPGGLLLASGVALLLWPGDLRITEYMAAGGVIGVLLALPASVPGTFGHALAAAFLSAVAFLVAGRVALAHQPLVEGAPPPERTLTMDAKAALDEALLAYFVFGAKVPSGEEAQRICEEAHELGQALQAIGADTNPAALHHAPPPLNGIQVEAGRIYGHDYERLSYPSGFTPDPRLPGAAEWAGYPKNNQAAAWMLRHSGAPRPWLVCIHGYRMGLPLMDFALFPPRWLHERLGLNLIMPVLPLHGPRRIGMRSGDYFLDGDLLDVLHAETQALWDLRRLIAWLRTRENQPRIGVLGYSLGGYNAALLAQYEADLDFAVAGIPAVDLADVLWPHIPELHMDYFVAHGLDLARYRTLLRPVSPLARPPLLSKDKLYIFAGAGDRVVLPDQPVQLAKHWEVPIQWYQGGHLTFRNESGVRATIEAAMARAGWPVAADAVPVR